MKQKFIRAHMKVAEVYAQLSSAERLKVGAVIVKEDTIIGIGYNGMPSGWINACEKKEYMPVDNVDKLNVEEIEQQWPYEDRGKRYKLITKDEVIHAESNAISKVAKSTNSTEGSYLFVTHAPCIHCAKLIHQSGIIRVFYKEAYRDDSGLKFLEKCGIKVMKISDDYILQN
jgi:dCMP deaminase